MITDISSATEELSRLGAVYVYLVEYRLTHSYMHLLLTGENFREVKAHLHLIGCSFICGKTLAGPLLVTVTELRQREQTAILIKSKPAHLKIRASRLRLELGGEPLKVLESEAGRRR